MSWTAVELSKALGNASADLRRDAEAEKVDIDGVLEVVDTLTETVQALLETVAELATLEAVH